MKTYKMNFLRHTGLALVCLMLGVVSCKEDEEEMDQLRMFMPTGNISSTSGESQVRLTWKESLLSNGQAIYTVEVAKDTLFETPVVFTGVTDTTAITITEAQLEVRQKYFARVKANSQGNTPESKWLTSNSFSIRGVQLFLDNPVKSTDLTEVGVILRFTSREDLTKIVLRDENGGTRDVLLTPSEIAAGQVVVTNLSSRTSYVANIFAGDRNRGTTTFRTKEPLAGILVDLRGIEGRPSVLQDTITQVPNGSTIILKRGMTYTVSSATNLDRSVTITSGTDLTIQNLASIYFTSNFNIVSGSNIDKIHFQDVTLSSDDATARYIFNINQASSIETLSFDNVKASKFRGLVRLQAQPTLINKFSINNSVVDSIGSYGLINVDVATSKVENISITNSTIYKAEKIVVSKSNSTSILIENVTINESPVAAQYLIDYNTTGSIANGIALRNVILGIGKAGSQTNRGIRAVPSTTVEVSNSYSTADYVTANFPITGLTTYSGTSLNLWVNPKNGDFRFKDQSFAGRTSAGDPRWR